jgi:hypothetical protein
MYMIDPQTLDTLLDQVQRVVLRHGNSDNKEWEDLEIAMLRVKLETGE